MNGYNGNPSTPCIDLEAEGLVVFRDFEKLKDQAFLSAAKAKAFFFTAKIGQHKNIWEPEAGHFELMTLYREIMATPEHEHHRLLKALDTRTACEYLKFKYPVLYIGTSLTICGPVSGVFENKHLTAMNANTKASVYFGWMKEEILSWDLFEQYGRVILFANEHHSYTPIHKDTDQQGDEFIWICLSGSKKFFVYDEATGTKHFMTGRAMTFSNADYHGSDPASLPGLSLRVDGVFKPHVREKLKQICNG